MNRYLRILVTLLIGTTISACGVTYQIHTPAPSGVRYGGKLNAQQLVVFDERPKSLKFSDGTISVDLELDGDQRELPFLEQAVVRELVARGVPMNGTSDVQPISVRVRDFGVRNRRATGWSPVVTYTRFSADVTRGTKTVRIAAYSKQVKMPVWSASELEGPCFNRPLQVVIGEVAAKLNHHFVGARATAARVAQLASRARREQGDALLQTVNELGWTNHPSALAPLLQLAHSESEEVRGAALGGIGTLSLPESLGHLEQVYGAARSDTDRYLALKAIADLADTAPNALAHLVSTQTTPGDNEDDIREITRLYLDGRPAVRATAAAHARR